MAAKLTKNLGPPSSTLHVANLPEELNHNDIKVKQIFICQSQFINNKKVMNIEY